MDEPLALLPQQVFWMVLKVLLFSHHQQLLFWMVCHPLKVFWMDAQVYLLKVFWMVCALTLPHPLLDELFF